MTIGFLHLLIIDNKMIHLVPNMKYKSVLLGIYHNKYIFQANKFPGELRVFRREKPIKGGRKFDTMGARKGHFPDSTIFLPNCKDKIERTTHFVVFRFLPGDIKYSHYLYCLLYIGSYI